MRIGIAKLCVRHLGVRQIGLALLVLLVLHAGAAPARGDEVLRVGKAVPEAFSFVPLDVGMR